VIACPSSTIELCIPAIIFKVALIGSFEIRFQHFLRLHMNKPEETWLTRAVAKLRIEFGSCRIQRRSLNCEIRYDQLPTHFDHVISQTAMRCNLTTMHAFILTTGTNHNIQECKRCSHRRSKQNLPKQSVFSKYSTNVMHTRKKEPFSFYILFTAFTDA